MGGGGKSVRWAARRYESDFDEQTMSAKNPKISCELGVLTQPSVAITVLGWRRRHLVLGNVALAPARVSGVRLVMLTA